MPKTLTTDTNRLRDVVGVSTRGLRAFRSRPANRRQRSDLVTLAHIKEQSRLSLNSYGRPRMTEELKEIGLNVGHRRVGRLMRQNGISVVRTRKHKVTTDSDHKFNIAPNLLDRDFNADQQKQKCLPVTDLFILRGVPAYIRSELPIEGAIGSSPMGDGPEFIAEAVRD